MTLYEVLNARLAFYRQVSLFGLQHNKAKVVAMCVRVMNDTLPKEFRPQLPTVPTREKKMSDTYEGELIAWCLESIPLVEAKYTDYMNAIAMQYRS